MALASLHSALLGPSPGVARLGVAAVAKSLHKNRVLQQCLGTENQPRAAAGEIAVLKLVVNDS